MNKKKFSLCLLMTILAAASNAQTTSSNAPQFTFNVPVELQNMPPEITKVNIWCQALNAVYKPPQYPRGVQDAKYLYYKGEPAVVAEGGISLPVSYELMTRTSSGLPWDINSIRNTVLSDKPGGPTAKEALAILATKISNFLRSPQQDRIAVVQANAKPLVDPALGKAYACRMEFEAAVQFNGAATAIKLFGPDPTTSYNGMPYVVDKTGQGAPVLYVFGNFSAGDATVTSPTR